MYREFDKATMHTPTQDEINWIDGFDRRKGHHDDIEKLTEDFLLSGGEIDGVNPGKMAKPFDNVPATFIEEDDRNYFDQALTYEEAEQFLGYRIGASTQDSVDFDYHGGFKDDGSAY